MKTTTKVLTLLSLLFSFSACQKTEENNNSSGDSKPVEETKITVKFYVDYTRTSEKDIYYTYETTNGSLLTPPNENPEPIYPEFPVFKGWSHKEIIDDLEDIWDFSTDKIETTSKTFNMFGIWMAEGE